MPSNDLLKEALNDAFRLHFAKLFEVLLVEPTDASVKRFYKGMENTCAMYDRIEKMINHAGSD
jgi:hypothetical protein